MIKILIKYDSYKYYSIVRLYKLNRAWNKRRHQKKENNLQYLSEESK